MYYVLCAATIERYGREGLNIYKKYTCKEKVSKNTN